MNYNNWYAVSININKERSCKEQLLARKAVALDTNITDVEYLEKKELVFDKGGKKKVVRKPLMAGYLLVRVKPELIEDENGGQSKRFPPDTFKLITETPGIREFVNCDRDRPLPMRVREVKKIFEMCDEAHLETKINMAADFQEGDILDVISGPFKGYKCEVVSVQGDKIKAQLDMFGRMVPAELTKEQVYKNDTP